MLVRQLHKKIKEHVFSFNGQQIAVTLSSGVAQYSPANNTKQALYFAADKTLYSAKNRGRDQYALFSTLPLEEV